MAVEMKIRIDGKKELAAYFAAKPNQIRRATLFTTRQITNELHKELGGDIPRAADTSVLGYRRARAKKTLPRAKRRSIRGVAWMGTKKIPAGWVGKPRQGKNVVRVRGHVFQNAFVRYYGSNPVVLQRIPGTRDLKEAKIDLPASAGQAKSAASKAQGRVKRVMREQLRKQLAKGK